MKALEQSQTKSQTRCSSPGYGYSCAPWARRRFGLSGCGEQHLGGCYLARLAAGPLWQDTGLVFTTSVGTALDASHVRRDFRALCKKADVEGVWAARSTSYWPPNGLALS